MKINPNSTEKVNIDFKEAPSLAQIKNTKILCPKCKTIFDISDIAENFKRKFIAEVEKIKF